MVTRTRKRKMVERASNSKTRKVMGTRKKVKRKVDSSRSSRTSMGTRYLRRRWRPTCGHSRNSTVKTRERKAKKVKVKN